MGDTQLEFQTNPFVDMETTPQLVVAGQVTEIFFCRAHQTAAQGEPISEGCNVERSKV